MTEKQMHSEAIKVFLEMTDETQESGPAILMLDGEPFAKSNLAAVYHDVADVTARLWCRQGKFPGARKISGAWFIPVEEVLSFRRPKRGKPFRNEG